MFGRSPAGFGQLHSPLESSSPQNPPPSHSSSAVHGRLGDVLEIPLPKLDVDGRPGDRRPDWEENTGLQRFTL